MPHVVCVCKQTSLSVGGCGVPHVVCVCCNVLTHYSKPSYYAINSFREIIV